MTTSSLLEGKKKKGIELFEIHWLGLTISVIKLIIGNRQKAKKNSIYSSVVSGIIFVYGQIFYSHYLVIKNEIKNKKEKRKEQREQ